MQTFTQNIEKVILENFGKFLSNKKIGKALKNLPKKYLGTNYFSRIITDYRLK